MKAPSMSRRSLLTVIPVSAAAVGGVPYIASAAAADPLVEMGEEYLRLSKGHYQTDEEGDAASMRACAIADEMVELVPTSPAGAAALVAMVDYEVSEGLIWDKHGQALRHAIQYLMGKFAAA